MSHQTFSKERERESQSITVTNKKLKKNLITRTKILKKSAIIICLYHRYLCAEQSPQQLRKNNNLIPFVMFQSFMFL